VTLLCTGHRQCVRTLYVLFASRDWGKDLCAGALHGEVGPRGLEGVPGPQGKPGNIDAAVRNAESAARNYRSGAVRDQSGDCISSF
jgi:hypothetical protein